LSFLSYPFFLHCSSPTRYLHSFPTRRSSDLVHHRRRRHPHSFATGSVRPLVGIAAADLRADHRARTRGERSDGSEALRGARASRSEEHTSELQSPCNLVCRLLLEKKKKNTQ